MLVAVFWILVVLSLIGAFTFRVRDLFGPPKR